MVNQENEKEQKSLSGLRVFAQKHLLLMFLLGVVLGVFVIGLLPADNCTSALLQAILLASITFVLLFLANPSSCGIRKSRSNKVSEQGRGTLLGAIALILLAAAVGGAFLALAFRENPAALVSAKMATATGIAQGQGLAAALFALAYCGCSAIFEEGVFRVLALDAFVLHFNEGRATLVKASLLSALLFALLHVTQGGAGVPSAQLAFAERGMALALPPLRFLQAALFGLCLACLYLRYRRIWQLVIVHTVFNLLYFGIPSVCCHIGLLSCIDSVALMGGMASLAALGGSALLLAGAMIVLVRFVFSWKKADQ